MVAALARPGRELARQLLMIQSGAVIFVAAGMAVAVNPDWGLSALIGGGIFVIANAVFALCAFMFSGARAAKRIAASFYTGEVLKSSHHGCTVLCCLHVYAGGTCSPQTNLFAGTRY